MVNNAVIDIYSKAMSLKPDGLVGVLNTLDPEEQSLKNLEARLFRRKEYLRQLGNALCGAPPQIKKEPLQKMLEPLNKTVKEIDTWLLGAKVGLSIVNKTVKKQNHELANAISSFVDQNLNLQQAA